MSNIELARSKISKQRKDALERGNKIVGSQTILYESLLIISKAMDLEHYLDGDEFLAFANLLESSKDVDSITIPEGDKVHLMSAMLEIKQVMQTHLYLTSVQEKEFSSIASLLKPAKAAPIKTAPIKG